MRVMPPCVAMPLLKPSVDVNTMYWPSAVHTASFSANISASSEMCRSSPPPIGAM